MYNKIKKVNGFTLVETIIYIAFIVIIAGVFVGFGIRISDIREKVRIIQAKINMERSVLNLISAKIKESDSIIAPNRAATSSELILDMPAMESNLKIFLQDGVLYFEDDDGVVQVTKDILFFDKFEFKNTTGAVYGKDSIKINADVRSSVQNSPAYGLNDGFELVVSLRR